MSTAGRDGVSGQREELKAEVGRQRISRGIAHGTSGKRGAVVPIGRGAANAHVADVGTESALTVLDDAQSMNCPVVRSCKIRSPAARLDVDTAALKRSSRTVTTH